MDVLTDRCPCASWMTVWGLVSLACSQISVRRLPSTHLQPTRPSVPLGGPRPTPGLSASTVPSSPLTKHTVCPSHVPMGHHALVMPWACTHDVFYALTLPYPPHREQDGWSPRPSPASPDAPLCSCVRWCVSVLLACHVM